jgi:hypothetical protein
MEMCANPEHRCHAHNQAYPRAMIRQVHANANVYTMMLDRINPCNIPKVQSRDHTVYLTVVVVTTHTSRDIGDIDRGAFPSVFATESS